MYLAIEDGKKIAMPRYYKQKLYSEDDRKIIGFFALQDIVKRKQKEIADYERTGKNYYRDQAEADKAAFSNMYRNAEETRTKI